MSAAREKVRRLNASSPASISHITSPTTSAISTFRYTTPAAWAMTSRMTGSKGGRFGQNAGLPPHVLALGAGIEAQDARRAAVRLDHAVQQAHQRGFARAVGAKHPEHFARLNHKRHFINRSDYPKLADERLRPNRFWHGDLLHSFRFLTLSR